MKTRIGLVVLFLASIAQISAGEDILVIGSTRAFAFSADLPVKAVSERDIVNLVKRELRGNVVFENVFRAKPIETAMGQGGKLWKTTYYCHSLAQWYYWPDGRKERLDSLRGKGKTKWKHIVLVGDPYLLGKMPGIYAEGVKLISDAVADSKAKLYLLIPWKDGKGKATVAEVVKKVGKNGKIEVLPAKKTGGLRFVSTKKIGSSSTKDSKNPFSMKYVEKRRITYHHTGTSSERGIERGIKAAVARCNVSARRLKKKENGQNIDFNYGRGNSTFEPNKQYKIDPSTFDRSYGFPMQDHSKTAPVTMGYGIDKRSNDGTDLGIGQRIIGQKAVPKDIRCIPIRLMWAKMHEIDPGVKPLGDGWHMSGYLNYASGAFIYTLLSGRCPVGDEPGKDNKGAWRNWLGQKIGYETAWRMEHLSNRVPGFKVYPVGKDQPLQPNKTTTLTVKFYYKPTKNITVSVATNNPAATASPKTLTFTPDNYGKPQTVTLTAGVVEAETKVRVRFTTKSKDRAFTSLRDTWPYTIPAPPLAKK